MTLAQHQPVTQSQMQALVDAVGVLRSAFPNMSDIGIICDHLLPHLLGHPPKYSNGYVIEKTKLAAVAANVICHGDDPETGEPFILLISRKELKPDGSRYKGHLGGYVSLSSVRDNEGVVVDLTRGEQPKEGAIGEAGEETKDAANRTLMRLTADRLELLTGGMNYKPNPPVAYFTFTAELTGAEIIAVKKHIQNLASDPAYKAQTLLNNGKEVFDMHMIPLSVAPSLPSDTFLYEATRQSFVAAISKLASAARPEPVVEELPGLILTF